MQHFRETPPPAEAVNQILDDLDRLLHDQLAGITRAALACAGRQRQRRPAPGGEAAKAAGPGTRRSRGIRLARRSRHRAADPLAALRVICAGTGTAAGNVDRLALALSDEHPRTVALVLDQMDPDRAGEVLRRLHPEMRRVVSVQLGREVASTPTWSTASSAPCWPSAARWPRPPRPRPATASSAWPRCCAGSTSPIGMEVLAALEQNDAQTAAQVKEFLYGFDDLLLIEDRSMQKLLAEIDSKSLASALKGAAEAIKDKVRNNLSKRARETLNEEMELLGRCPRRRSSRRRSPSWT